MNEVSIVFKTLDALQLACCAVVGFVAICRIGALQWGVHRLEPIVAQFMLLIGATASSLGFMFGVNASWLSTLFALCVAVCSVVGLSRWRAGAPSDAQRDPDDTVPLEATHEIAPERMRQIAGGKGS